MPHRGLSPRRCGEMSLAPKIVRVLHRGSVVARPLQQEITVHVRVRSVRAPVAPMKTSPSFTRVLPRSSAASSRPGGGNKIWDVLCVQHLPTLVGLEEHPDTSGEAVKDDVESSFESPDKLPGLRQIPVDRRRTMQMFCGRGRDGTSCKGGPSFREEPVVRVKMVEIYTPEYGGFLFKCPVTEPVRPGTRARKGREFHHAPMRPGPRARRLPSRQSFLPLHPEFGKPSRRRAGR